MLQTDGILLLSSITKEILAGKMVLAMAHSISYTHDCNL